MCYSGQSITKQKIEYARQRGDINEVARLERAYYDNDFGNPNWFADGFLHPKLLVYTNEEPLKPQLFTWGIVPGWSKTLADGKKYWSKTLNARGETIFEKPSFRNAAKNKRCLIYLDAFYEHHHIGAKKTIPFRIHATDYSPLVIAGLWEEWVDRQTGEIFNTTAIVTTEPNEMMAKIHNNPDADGPRMPVILTKENQDDWLVNCKTEVDKKFIQSQIKPAPTNFFDAHTVGRLKGNDAVGNRKEVIEKIEYENFELTW